MEAGFKGRIDKMHGEERRWKERIQDIGRGECGEKILKVSASSLWFLSLTCIPLFRSLNTPAPLRLLYFLSKIE